MNPEPDDIPEYEQWESASTFWARESLRLARYDEEYAQMCDIKSRRCMEKAQQLREASYVASA